MNRFAMLSTTLVAALAAIPAPMPAEAATEGSVVRCISPDGTIGYTDGNCAVFGAQAVPMDPELAARIATDRAYAADFGNDPGGAPAGFDADSARLVQPVAGRRSPASGCARNPAQLANDLEASVALGDVNRIAESYHFAGMSTAAGERVLDRLQRYAGRVVVTSQYFGGGMASAAGGSDGLPLGGMTPTAAWAGSAPSMVRLVFAGDDGAAATSLDLDVERYAGCYFVSFA
jgi:ABC-type amino acid transport substrate-binding protein